MEIALESDAENVIVNDDSSINVTTFLESFKKVQDAIKTASLHPSFCIESTLLVSIEIRLDKNSAKRMSRLKEMLKYLDDV